MGIQSNAGWHHFYMAETNSDNDLYLCNGAQHSSGQAMNHLFWVRSKEVQSAGSSDTDSDGIADDEDNCPDDANPDQIDTDGDSDGDACDADDDDDTVADAADNCPLDPNPNQADADGDGFGNICDSDDDNDGVVDGADLCLPTGSGPGG